MPSASETSQQPQPADGPRDPEQARNLRSAYIWNTAGSMLNAFQSVVMLVVITRVSDLTTAGIFTLAYAHANLFLTLGTFGMRTYQASDVRPAHSHAAYLRSRALTCTAMVACSWAWLAWSALTNGYTPDKAWAVAFMTLMKGMDAVEDVFDGSFQQAGRLDVAGRLNTFRTATTIVAFCVTMAATGSLVVATLAGFVWTVVFLASALALIRSRLGLPLPHPEAPNSRALPLLAECVPLFLASFLLFYVGNAPKYAIDALMDDATQAVYGFIAMPVFVVGLLAQFVYMPLVQPLSEAWAAGDAPIVRHEFARQIGIICAITLICVAGAALLGPPVLGWLYATDLVQWRLELCLLVGGGGLLALASLFTMGITLVRQQGRLVAGYVAVAALALVASSPLVGTWGILGAATCYVACMAMLAAWFGIVLLRCLRAGVRN